MKRLKVQPEDQPSHLLEIYTEPCDTEPKYTNKRPNSVTSVCTELESFDLVCI